MKFLQYALWARIGFLLTIIGPGIITGSVDNDPGGITTYSVAGSLYGYHMIWALLLCFVALLVIQEMNARMGIVTGKGLGDLIRETSGVKLTFIIFFVLLIADLGNTMTEFAGVAGSMEIFGVSKYISVPISAIGVWLLVVKGTYKIVEKIFLIFSLFLLSYIFSAILAEPNWSEIGSAIISPEIQWNRPYLYIFIALIGTTIAPWMQFYMQASVIEKGLKIENYKYTLIDIFVGCFITIVVAFFIMVACGATLFPNNIEIHEAKDAAIALEPFAGNLASTIFAIGLFVSAVFAATILPVATSFYICEAFGFEAGIDKSLKEAPQFYTLFTGILTISALVILVPDIPLIELTVWTQTINGILLPVVLIAMILIINNKEIMGVYVNKRWQNIIGWGTVSTLVILSFILVLLILI